VTGITDAAAAVINAHPAPKFFPVMGVITALDVSWQTLPVTLNNVTVDIAGTPLSCGATGGFLTEISLTTPSTYVAAFVGRTVKVELLGGLPMVACTVTDTYSGT